MNESDRHRVVLDAVADPIFRLSEDGRYLAYTGPAESKPFAQPDEFLGKRISEVLPADIAALCDAAIHRALSERAAITIEYDLELPSGTGTRRYETRIAPAGESEVIAIVRDVTESRKLKEELFARVTERTQEIATLSRRLLDIEEEQRRRIGRELHDQIGQMVTALSMLIAAARKSPDEAAELLLDANVLVERLQKQVRDLSFDLAPTLGGGLADALRAHVALFSQHTSLPIEVVCDPLPDIPLAMQVAALRIVQEALTNVVRHARASAASVCASKDGRILRIVIADDGLGFDPSSPRTGVGMPGMHERARLAGGRLSIDSAPEAGTSITAELPLDS